MSVTFCLGSPVSKRRHFRSKAEKAALVDNDDILGYFSVRGFLYALPGEMPFKDMTVEDYIRYQCSLKEGEKKPMQLSEIKYKLKAAGARLKVTKKLKHLDTVSFRLLCLACKLSVDTREVYINLDALPFSRALYRRLCYALKCLSESYDVFVAVSDSRFVPKGMGVLNFGSMQDADAPKSAVYRSRTVGRKAARRFFQNCRIPFLRFCKTKRPVLISKIRN